jgi:desulfoferrodoxin (superoxide reductase-like protein)
MNIWAILGNIGKVISFFKAVAGLIEGIAKNKEVPPVEQINDTIEKLAVLLDSGAIDVPNVDEHQIADVLRQIKTQLSGK